MRTHVYTDGSSDGGRRDCGVWSSSFTLLSRLPESSCVFTTELYAIFSAIKFISTNPGSYVLFADSLSALRALQSPVASSHYLHYWIASTLLKLPPTTVILELVPSHSGIACNETADLLAYYYIPPVCAFCSSPRTLPHVILHCMQYSTCRATLQSACRRLRKPLSLNTILDDSLPTAELLRYLYASGLDKEM